MKNSKALFDDFVSQAAAGMHRDEAIATAHRVFEKLFHLTRTDIMTGKGTSVSPAQQHKLAAVLSRLAHHEPVQYILEEAHFCDRVFFVNDAVLIPRPETEELVQAVLNKLATVSARFKVLDIGSGSGCIPITIALEKPRAEVWATDVSSEALAVASQNAAKHRAAVQFLKHNILSDELPWRDLDVIVSNPPYITRSEQERMKTNVTDYEPHLALFVPDDNPLLFYKAIVAKAFPALNTHGLLAVEINERFGNEVVQLFEHMGFSDVSLRRDISGKDRMVLGTKY